MSDDLPDRLRQAANHGTMDREPRSLVETALLTEAADYIDALRAELIACRGTFTLSEKEQSYE